MIMLLVFETSCMLCNLYALVLDDNTTTEHQICIWSCRLQQLHIYYIANCLLMLCVCMHTCMHECVWYTYLCAFQLDHNLNLQPYRQATSNITACSVLTLNFITAQAENEACDTTVLYNSTLFPGRVLSVHEIIHW